MKDSDNMNSNDNPEVLEPEGRQVAVHQQPSMPVATVMEQAAIAELKIAAQVAKMYPRNIMAVRQTLLDSCKRPAFAESARYAKPIGRDKVRGLSIRFAEEAMRAMGNIRVTELVIFDSIDERVTSVTAWDCETMAHVQKAVVTKKQIERKDVRGRDIVGDKEGRLNSYGDKVFLVRATDDEVLVKEAANCSKVRRNLILALIPADLKEEAEVLIQRTTESRDAADPRGEMKKLVDAFSNLRVKVQALEQFLGHAVDEASPAEIAALREVYVSVRDGEASFADHLAARDQEREDTARREPTRGDAAGVASRAKAGAKAGPAQVQDKAPEQRPQAQASRDASPAQRTTAARGGKKAAADPAADEAKAVAAYAMGVMKEVGYDDSAPFLLAMREVFAGADDLADVPAEIRDAKRDDIVTRLRALWEPMGDGMSDKVFEAIANAHPDSSDANDTVQLVINALCGKFNVQTMEDLPVWASSAWKTLGVTPETTPRN